MALTRGVCEGVCVEECQNGIACKFSKQDSHAVVSLCQRHNDGDGRQPHTCMTTSKLFISTCIQLQ